MKHFIFSSFFQSPPHFHRHRKDGSAVGTREGNSAGDSAQWVDVCTHSSSYLGVRLSQRCSCVHQKLAHGPVPLAGSLVQCSLTPKSKMKWKPPIKGLGAGVGVEAAGRGWFHPVADARCSKGSFSVCG